MTKTRFRFPWGLVISAIVLLILGLVTGPLIRSTATEEQLAQNVLLSAIPFILIFVSILLGFITVITVVARLLNDNINSRLYGVVEGIIIVGIVLGVVGMFQPWKMEFYKYGFNVLLISTLSFILWSHVTPRAEQRQEEVEATMMENKR
jgi:uncharacterized membrane protein YhaH (DUF805 family)